ncbi:MAG: NAD(P)/FAD-dependent oxidoreductase [Planctomycetota bacterium]
MSSSDRRRVIIIGAGFSGLCMAIRLWQAGIRSITILESADDVGGTWLKNDYPNAGCDVPSYLYSFSFATRYPWSQRYARQPEILAYLRHCAERFSIRESIQFGKAVRECVFDESTGCWSVHTDDETLEAEFVVSAVGQLNRPNQPPIPGLDDYEGATWHSARWNHDFEFGGKRVGVIGNGASAIQFLPTLAERAQQTVLFQRTPSWIQPFENRPYSSLTKTALRLLPGLPSLYRWWIFARHDWRVIAFRKGKINREYGRRLKRQMRKLLPEEEWERLIPTYSPGCKRILLSNDFLQTVLRQDVSVVSQTIQRVDATGIVAGEQHHRLDAIVFATGFKATELLSPLRIRGRAGRDLNDVWGERPRAFRGIAVGGFPNLFLLYGPNTNLGHNSIVSMIETQVNYVLRCLQLAKRRGADCIEVNEDVMRRDDIEVQDRLRSSIWADDCSSWYKTSDGKLPNNWWGSALGYWIRTRKPKPGEFDLSSVNHESTGLSDT